MPDEVKKTPSRIRTFAGDLDVERKKRGTTPKPKLSTEEKKPAAPTPKKDTSAKPAPVAHKMPKIIVPSKKKTHSKDTNKTREAPKIVVPEKNEVHHHTKPSPKSDSPASSKIPAFHELKNLGKTEHKKTAHTTKSIKIEKKNHKSKKSVLKNVGYDSTIITDTKSNRFKLFPSIVTSIKSWFKKRSAKHKKKPVPTYTVPETSRRKGVIQKATSKTGTIFTADSETLKEQIRRRQASRETTEAEEDEVETSWSPYTEIGYNLLEAPDEPPTTTDRTSNVTVEYKKQRTLQAPMQPEVAPSPQPKTTPPPIEAEAKREPGPVVGKEPTPSQTKVVAEKTPGPKWETDSTPAPAETEATKEKVEVETPPAPEPAPETPATTEVEPETETKVSQLEVEDITPATNQVPTTLPPIDEEVTTPGETQTEPRSVSSRLLSQFDTNTLTITLVIMVVGFIAIIFTARFIFNVVQEYSAPTEEAVVRTEPILQDTQLISILLTADNLNQLPQLLQTAITSAPDGTVELPVVSADGNDVAASYLFEVLKFRTAPSLRQSIITARFVTSNRSEPILVVKFVDKNTVLGGLLSWEETLASDMQNLYSIPAGITESFTDEQIGNIDVRTLRNNGDVVLVYGFTNDNTLIIAGSTGDFAQIAQP